MSTLRSPGGRASHGEATNGTEPGPLAGLRIGQFGNFDPSYSRNRILAKALSRAGAEVVVLTDRRRFALRTPALFFRALTRPLDLLLVGFPGHQDVATARLVATARRSRIPVVSDPLISMYESSEDRRGHPPRGLEARHLRLNDWMATHLADLVLVDTAEHGRYFEEAIGARRAALRRIWIGADDDILQPMRRTTTGRFTVFFYGNFNPLQGIEHIIGAAHLLDRAGEDIAFRIVGNAPTHDQMGRLAEYLGTGNVEFLPSRPHAELGTLMANSDLCLGIFGTSGKAQRVVPNKAFDALAMARPLITGDTPAAREAFEHGTHAWLCPIGDPTALAEAIATLKANPRTLATLATAGHERFRSTFSLAATTTALSQVVLEALELAELAG